MRRKLLVFALIVFGSVTALVSLAAADTVGALSEFPVAAGSVPFRIVSGADGALWFTDQGTVKAIGRITLGGAVTTYPLPAGAVPRQIRVGPDGEIWFTDVGTPAIGRVVPPATVTLYPLPAGSVPNALAVGADRNLWFTDRGTVPALGRITQTGTITEFSAGLNAGSLPNGIAPGPDGNLWFTDQGTIRALGRVTTAGAITEFSAGLNPGSLPSALTPGPDGNIWFTDQGTTKAIGRMTTAGAISELTAGLNPGSNPIEITPGADGSLWFTDRGTSKAVGQVTPTPTGATITNHALPATTLPGGIRTGVDGNLWFTDNGAPQAIGRFGIGAAAASTAAPVVDGSGGEGLPQTCTGAAWSEWAGQQPSLTAFGFDGYRWLLDGTAIAGHDGPTYAPTLADLGHELACEVTATYTLFPTTASASSAAVLVRDTTAPALILPAAITVNATGPDGAAVSYTATATDNVDPAPTVACAPPSASSFPIGVSSVHCTATDATGNGSTGSFTVTVNGAGEQLADLAASVDAAGPGRSLAAKIAAARSALAHGDSRQTCLELNAFEHELQAQTGKQLTPTQAAALLADANRIDSVLDC